MIPYFWLGALCLAILWTHTVLIAAAALQHARRLTGLIPPLRLRDLPDPMTAATLRASVPDGSAPIAMHVVEQRGRRRAARQPTVEWSDRSYRSELKGGKVLVETGHPAASVSIELAPEVPVEVWPDPAQQQSVGKPPNRASVKATYEEAGRATGVMRSISTVIGPGDHVWLSGRFVPTSDGLALRAPSVGPAVVSAINPVDWVRGAQWWLLAFSVGSVGTAAMVTWVALQPPIFGAVSTAGGVFGLLFFLLIQPAGVAIMDWTDRPCRRRVEGIWI